jgi:hypothetical protein
MLLAVLLLVVVHVLVPYGQPVANLVRLVVFPVMLLMLLQQQPLALLLAVASLLLLVAAVALISLLRRV